MFRLLNFTVIEKFLQMSASLTLTLCVAKILAPHDYAWWSTGLGFYLSLSPFLALLPSEYLARYVNARSTRSREFRALVASVIARSAAGGGAAAAIVGVLLLRQELEISIVWLVASLLLFSIVVETLGFVSTLLIRRGAYAVLLRGRAVALSSKVILTLLLFFWNPNVFVVAAVFFSDSLVAAAWNWGHFVADRSRRSNLPWARLTPRRMFDFIAFAVRLLAKGVPPTLGLMLYNFLLRFDRFLLGQFGSVKSLADQTICMQFVDPLYFLFCGYVINYYLQGRQLGRRKKIFLVAILSVVSAIASIAGPVILAAAPANIAVVSQNLHFLVWYNVAYGIFGLQFMSRFYEDGTSSAVVWGLGFLSIEASIYWAANVLTDGDATWCAPVLASLMVVWFLVETTAREARRP